MTDDVKENNMPEQDEPMEMRVFDESQPEVEVTPVTEEVVDEVDLSQVDPEKLAIQNIGTFCTLQVGQDPTTGEIQMGIVQIPVPLDMIYAFQEQLGEAMAQENMKLVVYKGRVFLAPVRTTSLIGFQ